MMEHCSFEVVWIMHFQQVHTQWSDNIHTGLAEEGVVTF